MSHSLKQKSKKSVESFRTSLTTSIVIQDFHILEGINISYVMFVYVAKQACRYPGGKPAGINICRFILQVL